MMRMKRIKLLARVGVLAVLFLILGCYSSSRQAQAADTYKIKINKQCCTVTVYKLQDGKYKAYKAFVCSPGYATPTGTFNLGEKMRWHTLDGPTYGQYCTRITGSILFHSVWYYQPEKNTQSYVQYNKLGTLASHGCVRLTVADSKWIYDNVPSGTSVTIYNSDNPGPLGKPVAIKVKGYQGWDPTDPDENNPYLKKNPKIKGVQKTREVKYGAAFDIMAGITATNTTGFDATKRIKATIYFREPSQKGYVQVDKFDSSQIGTYKIVYTVVDEIGHKAKKKSIITIASDNLVRKITLNYTEKTLYVGGKESLATFTLAAKSIKPENAPIQTLEFSSAGTSIATVDENGVVTALKKGEVYIKAMATDGSGVYERCHVVVEQLVTKVKITAPSAEMAPGETMQLKVTLTPQDANDQTVSYTSSNPGVLTVDEKGLVTAVASGSAVVKVQVRDKGKKSAKLTITVAGADGGGAASGSAASGASVSVTPNDPGSGGNGSDNSNGGINSNDPITNATSERDAILDLRRKNRII